jgi:predicted transcriptional regulator
MKKKNEKIQENFNEDDLRFLKSVNCKLVMRDNESLTRLEQVVLLEVLRDNKNYTSTLQHQRDFHKANTGKYVNKLAEKGLLIKKYKDVGPNANLSNKYTCEPQKDIYGLYVLSRSEGFNAQFTVNCDSNLISYKFGASPTKNNE